jgi:Lipid A 3-O-deacylase (PagL)
MLLLAIFAAASVAQAQLLEPRPIADAEARVQPPAAALELVPPAIEVSASPNPANPEPETTAAGSPDLASASDTTQDPKPRKHTPESELAVEGMVSYGNWEIFAAGINEHLYTAGFEYDRHSWGEFAGAQMDYAADFTPLVLLREPRTLNPYGVRRSKLGDDVILHGLAFSPIGLRMEWRPTKAFKPYFTVMGGAIGFTKKALSPDASYFDFTLHESIGFYMKMSKQVDMRFGLFGDFHFSNAYVTSYNPGLDNMNSQIAVSYHFGS